MQDDLARLAFQEAPLGLAVSRARVIVRANRAAAAMFGWAEGTLEGASFSALYPSAEEFDRTGERWLSALSGAGGYADERIMKRRCGALFWCRVRGRSLTPADPFAEAVWTFADLSETRPLAALTRRERQVAALLAEGRTSKEIARALAISPRTAESHRAKLLAKIGCRNAAELVAQLSGMPL